MNANIINYSSVRSQYGSTPDSNADGRRAPEAVGERGVQCFRAWTARARGAVDGNPGGGRGAAAKEFTSQT